VRGDQRTPLGVYHITSRLEDAELEDRYGPVAFPINYPNQWDLLQQRTGDGIWLHGVTSATYSRPPQDSDGCVALPNADIKVLDQFLAIGAPVIFGENENWVDPNARDIMRSELLKNIEAWRQDWESRDPDNYLSHYASDFQSKSHNIESWSAYKRRVNGSKKFIKVDVGQPIIYGYPGEKDMVQVEFEQEYTSDNYKGRALKQQYWKKQPDGQWRISYEGTIRKL
ncbi:MAG: L,D-transpeptidase family protein, partial [Gammaproteobacteria bacterium]|nr:L,D-transpeptidase family protein [Gammaproteobacteria bacterium]